MALTANGEVHTNEEAQVFVHDLRDSAITRRKACCSMAWKNSAKTTDIPMSGPAVKNQG